jgi:hypothetical protein
LGAGGGEGGYRGGGDGGAHLGESGGLRSRRVGGYVSSLSKKVLSVFYRLRACSFEMVDSAGVWEAMDWSGLFSSEVFLIITRGSD